MHLEWVLISFFVGIFFHIYLIKYYFRFLNSHKLIYKKNEMYKKSFLWGKEETWANNTFYTAKIITVDKKNSLLTKVYHKDSIKNIFVISGQITISLEKDNASHNLILYPGDSYEICPGTIYSLFFNKESRYIELLNYQINDIHHPYRENYDRQRD